ncbi:MAG: murein biosynthesis integral membrane protein MurJ [Thermodesulfobacteriota bacterium]
MSDRRLREKSITSAASVVGSATVLSRILGYARDAAIAYVFGAGMFADAFFVAFRISNLFRRLVGEGALTSIFIPIFTDEKNQRTREGSRALVSSVFTLFFFILVACAVLGIIFSDDIVRYMSPGFTQDPEKFATTVNLTRLMFPYMVFIGLMAIAMGVLNAYRHFSLPALAPVFFNIAIIISVFAVAPFMDTPVYALAVGVLAGGLLQFLIQVPMLRKYGMTPAPRFNFRDPAIKRMFVLMGPAVFGIGVYQLNIIVILWFASQLAEGSISYLYYAGRLMELPLGVFGVAVSTAVLPSLAEHVTLGDWRGFKDSLSFAIRIVDFVIIPATIGLLVLNLPIIELLFKRGEFTSVDASSTAVALYYYAVGLVPVAISRILVSVFYSLKDTATPVWVALGTFVSNVILCLLLVGPLGIGGLALATSLSSAINMAALFLILRRKFGAFGGRKILGSALKSTAASVVMGVVIYLLMYRSGLAAGSLAARALLLGGCVIAGVVTYIILAVVMRVPEVSFLKGIFRKGG